MAPASVGSAVASAATRCAAPRPTRREANHAARAPAPANCRGPPHTRRAEPRTKLQVFTTSPSRPAHLAGHPSKAPGCNSQSSRRRIDRAGQNDATRRRALETHARAIGFVVDERIANFAPAALAASSERVASASPTPWLRNTGSTSPCRSVGAKQPRPSRGPRRGLPDARN